MESIEPHGESCWRVSIALSRGQMSKSGGNSIEIRKAKAEAKLAQQNGLFLLTFAYGYSKIRV